MKSDVKKRIWAVMLAVCVCAVAMGVSPVAGEDIVDEVGTEFPSIKEGYSEGFKYSYWTGFGGVDINSSATIIDYDEEKESVVIPSRIDGRLVESVSLENKRMMSITIPNSVTSIRLSDCNALTSIIIPNSVSMIRLSDCNGLTNINIASSARVRLNNCNNLTSAMILYGVKEIVSEAFLECEGLTNIVIPDSVWSIGEGAFSGCKNLASIMIPDGVASIENKTFLGCSRLASITIPSSVTYIAANAIDECNALTDIYFTGSEEQWRNIDNKANTRGITVHYNSTGDNSSGGNTGNGSGDNSQGGNTGNGSGGNSQGGSTGNGSGGSTGTTPPEEDKPVSLAKVNLSAASNVSGGIELTWSSVEDAEQYDIYRRNAGGSWKKIAMVEDDTTRYVDTSVKSKNGTTYGYRIQAVSQDIKGAYSSEKTVYRQTTPKLSSVKNNKSKKVTVKWKKASKIDGYEVQYSTNTNLKKATIKKVKSASKKQYVISKLKKKNTYYIRIRTYMKVNKTTFYSAWSNAKQVKIKK